MRAAFRIGSIRGIPILAHWSFLLALPLLGAAFATMFQQSPWPWAVGLGMAVGLFASVLLHELAHTFYALKTGGQVQDITLLLIGGVSRISRMPARHRDEAAMALMGPLVSLALGGALLAASLVLSGAAAPPALALAVNVLGQLNIFLGLFNLLPAFPMDGGRIVRSLLANRMGKERATRTAATLGKGFALLFGLFGLLSMNLILLVVAFFVFAGADAELRQAKVEGALHGLKVGDLMSASASPLTGPTRLEDALLSLRQSPHGVLPVVDEAGRHLGLLSLEQARSAATSERRAATAGELATAEAALHPQEEILPALQRLQGQRTSVAAVVDGDVLVGLLTAADLARALREREPQSRGRSGGWFRRRPAHS
jgi:Zn-dependent protease